MGRQRTAIDEEGPRREGRSEERTMRRQRTAIDEEGPRREGRSEERTMGRQRTAIDGSYLLDAAVTRRWPSAASPSYALRSYLLDAVEI
jgi:hypothetical protein